MGQSHLGAGDVGVLAALRIGHHRLQGRVAGAAGGPLQADLQRGPEGQARALPDLATILAWESCEHLGPTFEGDRLGTRLELTACEPLADGGLVHIRVLASAAGEDGRAREVLDWRLIGLMP